MEDTLLTAKQVQELLSVDRTTIYRMIKDGRLQGVKVGKHWRFQEHAIFNLLQNSQYPVNVSKDPKDILFPYACMQSIQDVFAEVAEVGTVIVDCNGQPLTEISNSCEFCNMILDSSKGRQACINSWKHLTDQNTTQPFFFKCHAGLQYARARIDIHGELMAMLVSGQFYAEPPSQGELNLRCEKLADEFKIDPQLLKQAAQLVTILDSWRISKIISWLERVALSFKQIGTERGDLINRLRQITAMSLLEKPKFFR